MIGSGGGGGGRIALQAATSVSSSLAVSARAGAGSAGYAGCGGAAGGVFSRDTTGGVLVVSNEQVSSASGIVTPYPGDLSGYVLAGLDVKGGARLYADKSSSNNNLTSASIMVSSGSAITGDTIGMMTTNATIAGTVACTTLAKVRAMAGLQAIQMSVAGGGVVSCVGCEVDIKLVGSGSGESALLLVGEVKAQTVGLSADLVEVLGSQTAWTGAVTIEADEMVVGSRASVTVSAGASVLPGAAMRLELGRLEV